VVAVGFDVALTCTKRRVPCSITTSTYNIRNVAVTAMKKSRARIAFHGSSERGQR
jgi:hypothetical protein